MPAFKLMMSFGCALYYAHSQTESRLCLPHVKTLLVKQFYLNIYVRPTQKDAIITLEEHAPNTEQHNMITHLSYREFHAN
jgi:hypothetical protein